VRDTVTVFTCLSPVSPQVPSFKSINSGNQLPSSVFGGQWGTVESEVDSVVLHLTYQLFF
jgi:hypothetical protein